MKNQIQGFTLVELLLVMVIIVSLSIIGSSSYLKHLEKQRLTYQASSLTSLINQARANSQTGLGGANWQVAFPTSQQIIASCPLCTNTKTEEITLTNQIQITQNNLPNLPLIYQKATGQAFTTDTTHPLNTNQTIQLSSKNWKIDININPNSPATTSKIY